MDSHGNTAKVLCDVCFDDLLVCLILIPQQVGCKRTIQSSHSRCNGIGFSVPSPNMLLAERLHPLGEFSFRHIEARCPEEVDPLGHGSYTFLKKCRVLFQGRLSESPDTQYYIGIDRFHSLPNHVQKPNVCLVFRLPGRSGRSVPSLFACITLTEPETFLALFEGESIKPQPGYVSHGSKNVIYITLLTQTERVKVIEKCTRFRGNHSRFRMLD
ncbi:hypothetical protein SDC9_100193 [bioreactor metagenome]|uniref:Uncharacterized protein n=1 Tax=bioreactor metagenome TaxID=1076179 RepID=A0A645AJM7_9ZZZZ